MPAAKRKGPRTTRISGPQPSIIDERTRAFVRPISKRRLLETVRESRPNPKPKD